MNGVTINVLSLPVVSPTCFENNTLFHIIKPYFDFTFICFTINQFSAIELMNTYRELIVDEFFYKIL